jgi:beta-lactamase class C
MSKSSTGRVLGTIAAAFIIFLGAGTQAADGSGKSPLERSVDDAIRPVMQEHHVPGMVVALTVQGRRHFFSYGVAAKDGGKKPSEQTIFEIGSISKTFTATLASYAQASGALSLADSASKHLPALAGSSFDTISLLDLGTYTAGGLPLQFPGGVTDSHTMIAYYRSWRPEHAAGTHRLYSNPSVGLFGYLAARGLGEPFDELMEKTLFPKLGLAHTYLRVPQDQMGHYAWGHSKDGKPVRVTPGVLDSQAYGVKTTAADMIRYVEAHMDGKGLDDTLQRALAATRTGYYQVGGMTQGLGWEMYAYPTELETLLAGNSAQVIFKANPVTRLAPPLPPGQDMLVNKTGSTNGFGAYVAFVPGRSIGVVMLANRNYPIADRVRAGHRILMALDGGRRP